MNMVIVKTNEYNEPLFATELEAYWYARGEAAKLGIVAMQPAKRKDGLYQPMYNVWD